jgi:D-glycero-alpha-D-manno-heptose-7-phosphate kinase
MFYTGITRSADGILQEQKINTENHKDRRMTLRAMTCLAHDLKEALSENDLDSFGRILHQGWEMKQKMASGISSAFISAWYNTARENGALGGKILGAGGGGFLLLYAPPERHPEIKAALSELRAFPFHFEPQGTKIIYVEEN